MTQKWFIREECETDSSKGKRPSERSVKDLLNQGVVFIDKPSGPPSNEVTSWIQKELDTNKTGHFGTLDPFATGVLPIGLGRGTRISPALSNSKKQYICEVESSSEVSKHRFAKKLESFKGENKQVPPKKSAVKRRERTRQMHSQELLDKKQNSFLFKIDVESGFYVRVLVEQMEKDMDVRLELKNLRRSKQGDIRSTECSNIQSVIDEFKFWKHGKQANNLKDHLKPVESAVKHLPKIVVKDSAVSSLANGSDLYSQGVSKLTEDVSEDQTVAVLSLKGELVALATAANSSEKIYSDQCMSASMDSVFMEPNIYS